MSEQTRPNQAMLDKALRQAMIDNDPKQMELHIENGADVATMDFYALRWAARLGFVGPLQVALDALGKKGPEAVAHAIHWRNDEALQWASEHGHVETTTMLLEALPGSAENLRALAGRLARLAEDHRHPDTATALRAWGEARVNPPPKPDELLRSEHGGLTR